MSQFGHSVAELIFWRKLAKPLLRTGQTPFYIFSVVPIQSALRELDSHFSHLPVRHWLSFKTQPFRPLIRWWREQGFGVEVVSEFEFLAAREEGFAPDQILVNGPAKQRWLLKQEIRGLRVNFDSETEAKALLPWAKKWKWHLGVRINTSEEFDPETPEFKTQFGFEKAEAVRFLKKHKSLIETCHFHLRTNIRSSDVYENALGEVQEVCRAANWSPRFVDCGGGFPVDHVLTRDGTAVNEQFDFAAMAQVYENVLKFFPGAEQIWLENGRWLSARSGALVAKILEVKERGKQRNFICDGGRTMNAMISTWEQHEIISLPPRSGPKILTTVNGPTCMAFDQLTRRPLPRSLRAGDFLLWLDAGAYHLSWETRFSHGAAATYWHDGKQTSLVRPAQSFNDWWR